MCSRAQRGKTKQANERAKREKGETKRETEKEKKKERKRESTLLPMTYTGLLFV
jgi:hypothetical protein